MSRQIRMVLNGVPLNSAGCQLSFQKRSIRQLAGSYSEQYTGRSDRKPIDACSTKT